MIRRPKHVARWIVEHPKSILLVLAVLTAITVVSALRIRFDFSTQAITAGDNDAVNFSERFKRTFGYEDALVMIVLEATGDHDVLDRHSLTWQGDIAEELQQLDVVQSVQSIATLTVPEFSASDTAVPKSVPVIDQFPVDDAGERNVRRLVQRTSTLKGTFVSDDGTVGAILVFIDPNLRELEPMRKALAQIRQTLADNPPSEGYRYALSGLPTLRVDIVENLQGEQIFLLPIAALLFLLVLTMMFRRISGTLVPMLAVGVGMAWTVGVMAATGQSFNILSNMLPVLLMIIGISNSVHIVCRYAEEAKRFPGNRKQAVIATIEEMSAACFLTFVTTAIGFGSLASAHSSILRDFGWQAAMGVVLLYFSLILILGTLLPYFRPPAAGRPGSDEASLISRAISGFANAVARRPAPGMVFVLVVVCGSFWVSRNLVVNSSMIETYEEDHPTVRTLRLVDDKLAGILPIEVYLKADKPDRILEPDTYRKVAEFEAYARSLGPVLFARSYVDIHQDVYAGFRNKPELFSELPTNDEEGASRIRRSASLIRRAAESTHYSTFVSNDGDEARVLLRVRDIGTRGVLKLSDALDAKLQSLFPEGSGIEFRQTGDGLLNARSMDNFVRDLFVSLVTAAISIFAIIAVLFRSIRLGLIAAIPNITPLAVTLGYIGVRGYDLNAGNVVVFTISLGIAVDDTIHFLTRFREEMHVDGNIYNAIERAYLGTGRAIVLMTILMICGLSVLLLSKFVPTRRFAELTSFTMVAALFGDLLLLPSSLVLFLKHKPVAERQHAMDPAAPAAD